MKIFNKAAVILVLLMSAFSTHAQVTLTEHNEPNIRALKFWYADPNKVAYKFGSKISPHGDCFQVSNGYAFFAWYKGGMTKRNMMLSRMNMATKKWVTIEFPDRTGLYSSGRYQGAGNSHRTIAVGVSSLDGTVHLAYDMHQSPLRYRISKKNIAFAPDSEFTLENFSDKRDYFRPGEPISKFTYPNFEVNDAGELIIQYRIGASKAGDKYVTYYDGNGWSVPKIVMKGTGQNPAFNQYGDFTNHFGKLYLSTAVRVTGSPINHNQGFYFAETGQRVAENKWRRLDGSQISVPVTGLNAMNTLRIARPLPSGHSGMTASPQLVVSKNGAVHMTNRVKDVGLVHYFTEPGSTTVKSGEGPAVSFGGEDGRVYSVHTHQKKIRIQSTPEGKNDWRTDYMYDGPEDFWQYKYDYEDGQLHVIIAEDLESDKLPIHYFQFQIGNGNNDGPTGYTFAANEGQTVNITTRTDVAYGANGKFNHVYDKSSNVACTNETFGDPIPGVRKKCYTRPSKPDITIESVDAQQSPNVAANLLDGDKSDNSRWSAQGFSQSVVFDLGGRYEIKGTRMWTYQDRAYKYRVLTSDSPDSGFSTRANRTDNTSSSQPLRTSFTRKARYVKLIVAGAHEYNGDWVSINEFEILVD